MRRFLDQSDAGVVLVQVALGLGEFQSCANTRSEIVLGAGRDAKRLQEVVDLACRNLMDWTGDGLGKKV
jgi:hypothetical protein